MRFSSAVALALGPLSALAAPARLYGRQADENEILVFRFADVLEQLELEFYRQAVARFGAEEFTAAGFTSANVPAQVISTILRDEEAHSVALQAALRSFGAEPITTCQFNFEPALTDVATVAATARVVENVGVGAYLGGATLLSDPVLLTAAGSILTIEARHQTILNLLSGTGSAIPQAFDIALTPQEVLALAGPFIDPASPCDLGIEGNTPLTITNTETPGPGTVLTFTAPTLDGVAPETLFCNMIVGGAAEAISLPLAECRVPEGINGPVALWITNNDTPLINNIRDRDTASQVAGPALAFIDIAPEALGQAVRTGGALADGISLEGGAVEPAAEGPTPEDAAAVPAEPAVEDASVETAVEPAAEGEAAADPATDLVVGRSEDGSMFVNGWSSVPASSA